MKKLAPQSVLAIIAGLLLFSSASAQVPDLAGIKLGDTEVQALAGAKKYFGKIPTEKDDFYEINTKAPLGFEMRQSNRGVPVDRHTINHVKVGLGSAKRVQYIELTRSYMGDPENRPSFHNLSEAIQSKFGQPSVVDVNMGISLIAFWFYDAQMQQISGDQVPRHCRLLPSKQGTGIETPNVARPKCPISVRLSISKEIKIPDLVSDYNLTIFDEPALMADIRAQDDAERKKREAESAAGRAVKPKL